jgi:hypothetical protein
MKLSWIILGLLLGMCAVVVMLFVVGEEPKVEIDGKIVATGHGTPHPEFGTMQRGGDGIERHSNVMWLAWIYGVLQFILFALLVGLGARKAGRLGYFKKPVVIGFILHIVVFSWLMFSYWQYANGESTTIVGSFPWSTALLLYGLWPLPLFYLLLYVWSFDRHILTNEDMEKFRQLVEANRVDEGDGV